MSSEMSNEELWEKASKIYYGAQDRFMEENNFVDDVAGDYIKTDEISGEIKTYRNYKIIVYKFGLGGRDVYKNFRFEKSVDYDHVDFIVGSQRHEQVYGILSNDNKLNSYYSKHGYQTLTYHDLEIEVHLNEVGKNEDVDIPKIYYDVHDSKVGYRSIARNNLVIQKIYRSTDDQIVGNHVGRKLIGVSDKNIEEITFKISEDEETLFITVKQSSRRNNIQEYMFPCTLNFSRINRIKILNNPFKEEFLELYHPSRNMGGMSALIYSK